MMRSALLLLLALLTLSQAAIINFNGTTIACAENTPCNFTDPSVWAGGVAPGANDTANITSPSSADVHVVLSANTTLTSLLLAPSVFFTVNNVTLTVSNTTSVTNASFTANWATVSSAVETLNSGFTLTSSKGTFSSFVVGDGADVTFGDSITTINSLTGSGSVSATATLSNFTTTVSGANFTGTINLNAAPLIVGGSAPIVISNVASIGNSSVSTVGTSWVEFSNVNNDDDDDSYLALSVNTFTTIVSGVVYTGQVALQPNGVLNIVDSAAPFSIQSPLVENTCSVSGNGKLRVQNTSFAWCDDVPVTLGNVELTGSSLLTFTTLFTVDNLTANGNQTVTIDTPAAATGNIFVSGNLVLNRTALALTAVNLTLGNATFNVVLASNSTLPYLLTTSNYVNFVNATFKADTSSITGNVTKVLIANDVEGNITLPAPTVSVQDTANKHTVSATLESVASTTSLYFNLSPADNQSIFDKYKLYIIIGAAAVIAILLLIIIVCVVRRRKYADYQTV